MTNCYIPKLFNLSYNLNTLAANCAQFPDDDFLVESIWILTFYQTFSLSLTFSFYIQYRSRVTLRLTRVTRLARMSHSTIYARVFGECCYLCPIMHTSEMHVDGESDFFCLKNVLYFCNLKGADEDNNKTLKNSLQTK